MELIQNFKFTDKIIIYNQGEASQFCIGEPQFDKIIYAWQSLIEDARRMPAFGVSLNYETKKAILNGVWIEFCFPSVMLCDGMTYEKLLVEVNKEWEGFNLIRYNSACKYEGRCFYLNLNNKTMSNFYKMITNI